MSGKTILVTGGTRGIGQAITLRFARAGARVVACYIRNEQSAEQVRTVARDEGLDIVLCRADIAGDIGIERVAKTIEGCGPHLSGFIHCAATGVHRPVEELTARHLAWTFELNVFAFFKLVHMLLPRFEKGSSIVAVSSWGATRVLPCYSFVGASKGALEALARHLAVELAPRGIRVNIICPGTVLTEVWKALPNSEARLAESLRRTPAGRLVTPEDVAAGAYFLCSDAAAGIIGHSLVIDGGAGILA
jgi:enoyl-[acyl-carrier protein] reductase III